MAGGYGPDYGVPSRTGMAYEALGLACRSAEKCRAAAGAQTLWSHAIISDTSNMPQNAYVVV